MRAKTMKQQRPSRLLAVVLSFGIVASAGCEQLLDVEAPTQVPEEVITDPQNADLLLSSVMADLSCAFTEYIVAGGLLGDEIVDSQLAARMWDYDRRTISEASPQHGWTCGFSDPGIYQTMATARFSADNAVHLLEGFSDADVPNRDAMIATAEAFSGYSRVFLGEAYCSVAGLESGEDGPVLGGDVSSAELFARAQEHFGRAIQSAEASGASQIANLARIGRARARLNLGDTDGALADASAVPAGFSYGFAYSDQSFRSSNRIWTMNNRDQRITIEDDFHDVTFGGTLDPRVPVVDREQLAGADNYSPWWTQEKYPAQIDSIPLARYAEAQLIIAEVELGQTAVDIINELHRAANLPEYDPADVTDDIEVLGHVIEERRREFFLESHHFHDKLRYRAIAQQLGVAPATLNPNLPVSPVAGEPFPQKGGSYGELQCLPLPEIEEVTNPNIG